MFKAKRTAVKIIFILQINVNYDFTVQIQVYELSLEHVAENQRFFS